MPLFNGSALSNTSTASSVANQLPNSVDRERSSDVDGDTKPEQDHVNEQIADEGGQETDELVKIVTHHPAFMPASSQVIVPGAEAASLREKFSERAANKEDYYKESAYQQNGGKKRSKDSDDNKYARKSLLTLLSNFLKAHQINPSISRQRLPSRKLFRFGLYACFLLFFLMTAVAVLQTLSRYLQSDDSQDPMLNPRLNPNIRIQDKAI